MGWVSEGMLIGVWAGVGAALVGCGRGRLFWGVLAGPWLGLVAVWPWVEPAWVWEARWWTDVVWAVLASAVSAVLLWKVCRWGAQWLEIQGAERKTRTPWYALRPWPLDAAQREGQEVTTARQAFEKTAADKPQEELGGEPWISRFVVRGLRVALWKQGASVEATHGGWPEANQRAMNDEAKAVGAVAAWDGLRVTFRGGNATAVAVLAAKATGAWATRGRAAGDEAKADDRRAVRAMPVGGSRYNALGWAAAMVGLWVGNAGALLASDVLVYPVMEGGEWLGWLLVAGGWGLFGVWVVLAKTVLRVGGAQVARESAQDVVRLLETLHDEQESERAEGVPRAALSWWSLDPKVSEDPEAAWRAGVGVGVGVEVGQIKATLRCWPLPATAHGVLVQESLCVWADGEEGLAVAYLRAGLVSVGGLHEGERNGETEKIYLEATRMLGREGPWRALERWWELRTQGEQIGAPALLQRPWRHELEAKTLEGALLGRWRAAEKRRGRAVYLYGVALLVLSLAVTQAPHIRDGAFDQFKVLGGDAAEIAAAVSDCPMLGTNTHQRLEALRCAATAMGQHQPLRRVRWDVLLRPLVVAMEAHKALQDVLLGGQGCEQGRRALAEVLGHPSVRVSVALLERHHAQTWQAVKPFFWPNDVLQMARALDWERLERWVGGCERVLGAEEMKQLGRFYHALNNSLGKVLR